MQKTFLILLFAVVLTVVFFLPSEKVQQAIANNEPPPYKTGITSPGSQPVEPPNDALQRADDVLYFEGKVDWLALNIKSPRTAWEHLQFGMFLQDDLDRVDEASEHFRKAIEMDVAVTGGIGKMLVPHARLGQIALERGNYDEAIERFTRVSEIDPILLGSYERIAEAYHKKGDTDKALEFFIKEQTLQMGKNQKIMFELGEIYLERNEKDKALESFQNYLEEAKFHGDTYPLRIELVKKKVEELNKELGL